MKTKGIMLAGFILIFFGLLISGCDNTGSSSNQTPKDVLQDAVEAVFVPISSFMDQDMTALTFPYEYLNGITFDFDGSSILTTTFNGYADINTGYTINGTITLSRTISGTTMTITAIGTVTLTGGSVSELDFDISASGAYDSVEDDFDGDPSYSGTITADGTSYDFADFDLFGTDTGDGSVEPATIDPRFIVAGMKVENPSDSGTYYSIVAFSADGSVWGYPNVSQIPTPAADLLGIASDNAGNCVAVGKSGTILYSDNGLNWIQVGAGTTTKDLNSVVWGNGTWVAVADQQTILYSNDGQVWTAATISGGSTDALYDVTTNGSGTFVAVGQDNCAYSTDGGQNWTVSLISLGTSYYGIAYDGLSRWVTVGAVGRIYHSNDNGQTWTIAASSETVTTSPLSGLAFGNGKFIAVGPAYYASPTPVMIQSSDGDTWTNISSSLPSEFTSLGHPLGDIATDGSGKWSALGNNGDHLLSTDNGVTWQVTALDKYGAYAIAYRP